LGVGIRIRRRRSGGRGAEIVTAPAWAWRLAPPGGFRPGSAPRRWGWRRRRQPQRSSTRNPRRRRFTASATCWSGCERTWNARKPPLLW